MRLSDKLDEYLESAQGRIVALNDIRTYCNIEPGSADDVNLRNLMRLRSKSKIVVPSGRKDGLYKVVKRVKAINVFGSDIPEPVDLKFPRDYQTEEELDFAEDLVIRGGDLILIAGTSNYGKTTMALSFAAENIDKEPVLMGNEYTTIDNKPTPRFLTRIKNMDWVHWQNGTGIQKFTLLPVREDYAEHIVKDKINIIDWINLTEHYEISRVSEDIKRELGDYGVGIIVIQRAEGAQSGRGGQFTKDFTDVEILLDKLPESENEILLTIGKVKESKRRVTGRSFAYSIEDGVKIINFRELAKCYSCHGKGWIGTKPCSTCDKRGYLDK